MDPIQIPGKTNFRTADGVEFGLDLVEANLRIIEIGEDCKGKSRFEHVAAFAAWVAEQGGPKLTLGEADFLIDRVLTVYADQKKAVAAALNSPSSTALPHSN